MTPRYALLTLLLLTPVAAQPTSGSCSYGTAAAALDVNEVRARLYNQGMLFYDEDEGVGMKSRRERG